MCPGCGAIPDSLLARCPRCGVQIPEEVPRYDIRPIDRIVGGRYRLETLIGHGRLGSVWRGHDLQRDETVAVKLLSPGIQRDSEAAQEFVSAGERLANLRHPHLVSALQVGEESGRPFVVMRYILG